MARIRQESPDINDDSSIRAYTDKLTEDPDDRARGKDGQATDRTSAPDHTHYFKMLAATFALH